MTAEDEASDLPAAGTSGGAVNRKKRYERIRSLYPGMALVGTIGVTATWLSQHYAAPVMLFALLTGVALHFLQDDRRCRPGIEFTSKVVLKVGVALLGARITVGQIVGLGWHPIALVVLGVATTVALGALAARILGLSRSFGVLSGGSVSICGASAALAIASVLPRSPETERDTILTVVSVTAMSTVAMILYPLVAARLHLSETDAGIFFGGTIHDVAQVLGAGYAVSQHAGDVATYVKLLRVSLLIPVVLLISGVVRHQAQKELRGRAALPTPPLFLVAFAALVVMNSVFAVPAAVSQAAGDVSSCCLVVAIAALGVKTTPAALLSVGWRPIALVLIETVWIGLLVLGALVLMP